MRIARRQRRIGVLEIGQVGVHRARIRPHGRSRLVARRVPQHRQRQPPTTRDRDGRARLRRVVGRRHKVHVERALRLKLQAHLGQPLHAHRRAGLAGGDDRVLAVDAPERAVREEHRAASRVSADGGLLPEMQRRARHHERVARAARAARARSPIGSAGPRAQVARRRRKRLRHAVARRFRRAPVARNRRESIACIHRTLASEPCRRTLPARVLCIRHGVARRRAHRRSAAGKRAHHRDTARRRAHRRSVPDQFAENEPNGPGYPWYGSRP